MARIIEFRVPDRYVVKAVKWISEEHRGRVIEFPAPQKKSA